MFDNNKVTDISIIKPAERVEGCELVRMSRDKDPQSKSFRSVTFHFAQKVNGVVGAILDERIFAPGRQIGQKTLTNEEYKKNIGLTHARVAHITRAFLDEATFSKIIIPGDLDQALVAGNYASIDAAWDAYITMTGQALGADATHVAKAKGVVCALKVIYNGKYAGLPKIPPFISTQAHPKVFTTNPQYDKYVLEAIRPDIEQPTQQNAGGFAAAPSGGAPAADFSAGAATNHPSGF